MSYNFNIDDLSDGQILALTVIGEARGESIESQVGVASVIRNRLLLEPSKYKNYRDVCLERSQFSCWNENDPNYKYLVEIGTKMLNSAYISDPYLRQCLLVANAIIGWNIVDNTQSAIHYLTTKLLESGNAPVWARIRKNEIVHGNHTFFNV